MRGNIRFTIVSSEILKDRKQIAHYVSSFCFVSQRVCDVNMLSDNCITELKKKILRIEILY